MTTRIIGVILRELVIFITVVMILSALIASSEATLRGESIGSALHPANLVNKTKEYFQFSADVFKNEDEKVVKITRGNSTLIYYIPTPHSIFTSTVGTTPGTSILLTLAILSVSLLLILIFGALWGLRAGYREGISDRILRILGPSFSAIPGWFWAVALLWILWWKLSVLPLSYLDYIHRASVEGRVTIFTHLKGLALPILTLTLVNIPVYAMTVRNLIIRAREEDYVITDVLKGLPDGRIERKLLRVVLPSFLTFTSYSFLNLLMNDMAVEVLFNVPGIGRTFMMGVGKLIFSLNGSMLFFASLVMSTLYFVNASILEGLYLKLDPRVRRDA
ncbi:ABC-type dipeptide/oligopeptide/nickel transport systems, permease components [Thermococcus nautili]|uniref:ABC-type dipeptide/oligopeptide/nickel transport systems, permease components n=2 Tax=Thermococcus nautili TaxID=195522 RepID=W8PLT8_9EURY|nr:ABC-type dipeptide/oligopeptide/nickel transport systems, permease components [Thermococcus nautili]